MRILFLLIFTPAEPKLIYRSIVRSVRIHAPMTDVGDELCTLAAPRGNVHCAVVSSKARKQQLQLLILATLVRTFGSHFASILALAD